MPFDPDEPRADTRRGRPRHERVHHPGDIAGEEHGPDDHGETTGTTTMLTREALGPVDVAAWGAFVVGIGAGLLIVICLALATPSRRLSPASRDGRRPTR